MRKHINAVILLAVAAALYVGSAFSQPVTRGTPASKLFTPSAAGTMAINTTLGDVAKWTTHAGDETLTFTGGYAGQWITLIITDDDDAGNVARTITFGAGIAASPVGDAFTFSAENATATFTFVYDGTVWRMTGTFTESADG